MVNNAMEQNADAPSSNANLCGRCSDAMSDRVQHGGRHGEGYRSHGQVDSRGSGRRVAVQRPQGRRRRARHLACAEAGQGTEGCAKCLLKPPPNMIFADLPKLDSCSCLRGLDVERSGAHDASRIDAGLPGELGRSIGSTGKAMIKSVPRPGSECSVMCPPCPSTTRRVVGSPSPVPDFFVEK
mgnify:CR=1 FL=1